MLAPHPDDVEALTGLRDALKAAREAAGLSGFGLSRQMGRNDEFVSNLERSVNASPYMSSLQVWAQGLGLRIEFGLRDFWLYAHSDREMLSLYAASRPWGSDAAMRQWLVSALRAWRVRQGIDVLELAPQLNTDVSSVRRWESESADPSMMRAMWQARLTGTQITWRLFTEKGWRFG